jgi:hypothetical protein
VTQGRYNWNGGTDAGGGELSPYTVHLSEVKSGVIKHVMHGRIPGQINSNPNNLMFPATYGAGSCNVKEIVGWTVTSGGSGYSPATKITVSGGGQATPANKFTPILSGGVLTGLTMIHSAFNGDTGGWNSFTSAPTLTVSDTGGGTGATVTATIDYPCIPMGARWVLKSTYLTNHTGSGCPAGSNCLTGAGLTVATALNAYGMFDLDNNGTTLFSVDMSPDLYYDPTVYNQIHGQIPTIPFSAFDIVDQSKLAISTANGVDNQAGCSGSPCSISQVQPDNDLGLTVPGSVWITATNASGSSLSADVSLIPPTIGTLDELIYVKAGDYSGSKGTSGGIQIPYWIHGVSGSPTVAWTCASCTGSVTTAGIYTPPASLSTTGTQDVLVGTLSSDANVTKTIYVTLLPNAGNYVASTIRADVANSSNFGPDGNAHYWVGNIGAKTGDVSLSNTTLKYGTNPQEATVYATAYYSTSEDDHHYKFYLPNGNYRVRILTGWIDNQSITVTSWNHMPGHALVTDGGTDHHGSRRNALCVELQFRYGIRRSDHE